MFYMWYFWENKMKLLESPWTYTIVNDVCSWKNIICIPSARQSQNSPTKVTWISGILGTGKVKFVVSKVFKYVVKIKLRNEDIYLDIVWSRKCLNTILWLNNVNKLRDFIFCMLFLSRKCAKKLSCRWRIIKSLFENFVLRLTTALNVTLFHTKVWF